MIEEQKDNQFSLPQEAIEELRTEFITAGGIVTALPDVSTVRNNTQVQIQKFDANNNQQFDLYQMIDGKWFHLTDVDQRVLHAEGSSEQYETETVITIDTQDVPVEILEGWTNHFLHNMTNGTGVFTVVIAGDYQIHWSLSLLTASPNKDFAAGIMIDHVAVPRGWAHLTLGASSDTGSMSSASVMKLRGSQKISLGILNHTDDANCSIEHASFSVIRIR